MLSFWQWRHPMPFSYPFQKKTSPNDKKKAKSLAVSRILLTFAIELEQAEKNGCDEDSNE